MVVIAALLSACLSKMGLADVTTKAPETFRCPARTIKIAFDTRFTKKERLLGEFALLHFRVFGIQTQVVSQLESNVEVRKWTGHRCSDHLLGQYTLNDAHVLIDPSCIHSDDQYQSVVVHEIGHWLGMRHICEKDGKTTDVCSPVGKGRAVLNPYLSVYHLPDPQRLDVAEYNRICWMRIRR